MYALVDKKSMCFTSDVPGFLLLTKSLKDSSKATAEDSSMVVIDIRCCVNSMSINLISLKRDSNSRDVVGRMEMGFILSATLKNDMISCSDIQFTTLMLSASPDPIYLAKFLSDGSSASVFDICLSIQQNETELLIAIPSLEIWFHLSDWLMLIDHVRYCILKLPLGSVVDTSDSTSGLVDLSVPTSLQSLTISTSQSDILAHSAVAIVVKSKKIGLSCHIPVWVNEEAFAQSEDFDSNRETLNAMIGGKDSKFLTVTLQSQSSELHVHDRNVKFKTNFHKVTGSVGICESGSVQSWPFFQLSQLGTEIQIIECEKVPLTVNVEVHCESFDVWLSQQVFYFWHGIEFGTAEDRKSVV